MAKERQFAQRELELDDVRRVLSREPWGGKAPRELTRSFMASSLAREGMGRLDLDASRVGDLNALEVKVFQLELHLEGISHG